MAKNSIVIGDLNCQFGTDFCRYGLNRANGKSYRNSYVMMNALQRCNMCIVDFTSKAKGPHYTFSSYRNDKFCRSYIDHCAVSIDLSDNVVHCEITCDEISNVSDHLPINVVVRLYGGYEINGACNTSQAGWYKATSDEIMSLDTLPLEDSVSNWICCNDIDFDDYTSIDETYIETVLKDFTKMLLSASNNLTEVKYNKALRAIPE